MNPCVGLLSYVITPYFSTIQPYNILKSRVLFLLACNFILQSQQVQQKIVDMQGPLQTELTEGVATFLEDVLKFDADYETSGPMTPGLSARDASDRY